MDQTTLIKRCQQGDLESFEQLYKIYIKNAMGTAYLIAGQKGIAEDIVQEAFFQCYKEIGKLRNPAAFDVWFYKLLVRQAWKMSSKQRIPNSIENINYDSTFKDGGIDKELDWQETRLIVHEAIEKLSPPLKTAVILYYFNDMTIAQISGVLDCFQGTVKSRLHNAKKILQKELSESMDEHAFSTMYMAKECKTNG